MADADRDTTKGTQDRVQNRFVIILLVDDVTDRTRARELQNESVHPADMIGYEKKAAAWQILHADRSDAIKAAHQ